MCMCIYKYTYIYIYIYICIYLYIHICITIKLYHSISYYSLEQLSSALLRRWVACNSLASRKPVRFARELWRLITWRCNNGALQRERKMPTSPSREFAGSLKPNTPIHKPLIWHCPMQWCVSQHNTMWRITTWRDVTWHGTAQPGMARHSTTLRRTTYDVPRTAHHIPHSTPHFTSPFHTTPYSSVLHSTPLVCGVAP